MKKSLSFLFVLCCLTAKTAAAPVASITLNNPPAENNITQFTVTDPNNEPYTINTSRGGQACIEVPATKYAYFQVTNNAVVETDNNLIVKITYFDEGTGELKFQYNSTLNNYTDQVVKKTGSNEWITTTIAITNASFKKAQNNGCDFRIAGGPNFIREISIEKGEMNPANEPKVPVAASEYSEFIGKSVAGYQAWFSTGDGASGWFHWSGNTPPAPGRLNFEIYPDVTEYAGADLAQTDLGNLGNGEPSELFNSANTPVINMHFEWMKDYGIDGVALQRFINGIGTIDDSQQSIPVKVKNAAEANGRIFYICYDISSTGLDDVWAERIKLDWVYNIEKNYALTQSPNYAKVGNRPVVEIWGTGFTDNHPGTEAETIELIEFLQERGCYVIGGLPTHWRNQTGDSKPNFINAYNAYDMISPWLVGRFGDNNGADGFKNQMAQDKAYCDQRNIDYMPVIFSGFAWSQWNNNVPNEAPRNAGEFMWHQAKNIQELGVDNMYFAMFDEYDEATAIMKAATDWSMIPTDQYFLTTSADGYWLSSDFQLRVAAAATEMLKGIRPVTENVPVPHSLGPVYYRNSFESRTTPYKYQNGVPQLEGTFPLDPCFKNPAAISATAVSGQNTMIEKTALAKSGLYTARINGSATAANGAYFYKFADANITVTKNMELIFSKYTVAEQGKYTTVSLLFDDGTYLHNTTLLDEDAIGVSPANARGELNTWTDHTIVIGTGNLIGRTIKGILLGYQGNGAGSFDAHFDNLLVQDGDGSNLPNPTSIDDAEAENIGSVFAQNGLLHINGYPETATLSVFNLSGERLFYCSTISPEMNLNLSAGIYIVKVISGNKTETHKMVIE